MQPNGVQAVVRAILEGGAGDVVCRLTTVPGHKSLHFVALI